MNLNFDPACCVYVGRLVRLALPGDVKSGLPTDRLFVAVRGVKPQPMVHIPKGASVRVTVEWLDQPGNPESAIGGSVAHTRET